MKNFKVESKLGKCFLVIDRAGSGSFSTVFKVRRFSDNKTYALKKVCPI